MAPHLWSGGSGDAGWTRQATYSSLALVALKHHIGNTLTNLLAAVKCLITKRAGAKRGSGKGHFSFTFSPWVPIPAAPSNPLKPTGPDSPWSGKHTHLVLWV